MRGLSTGNGSVDWGVCFGKRWGQDEHSPWPGPYLVAGGEIGGRIERTKLN